MDSLHSRSHAILCTCQLPSDCDKSFKESQQDFRFLASFNASAITIQSGWNVIQLSNGILKTRLQMTTTQIENANSKVCAQSMFQVCTNCMMRKLWEQTDWFKLMPYRQPSRLWPLDSQKGENRKSVIFNFNLWPHGDNPNDILQVYLMSWVVFNSSHPDVGIMKSHNHRWTQNNSLMTHQPTSDLGFTLLTNQIASISDTTSPTISYTSPSNDEVWSIHGLNITNVRHMCPPPGKVPISLMFIVFHHCHNRISQ